MEYSRVRKPCQSHYNPHQYCLQVWNRSSYDYPYSFPYFQECLACVSKSSTHANQLHHQNHPCPTKYPTQLIPHPYHNKPVQHAYNVELQNLPTLPTQSISHTQWQKTYIEIGNISNPKIVEVMEEKEVSSSLHQQVVLETQELHDMTTMGNQESKGYIEDWFHSISCSQHHSILQQFLTSYVQGKLVSHTLVFIDRHFSNSGVYTLEALFLKWLHWKYSYT